ncbi:uncharacterized protein Z518_00724 [Rhinocladiella mackenziei CBS 650.93]|uniref:catechol O-methyltransferase n=1 Tax=Rhinocladiella mackenziei CBS 650.93 TaxID=1442369 RepID=A0A0D2HG62_9EURO|nr:uncharacterized protein Z518_00724 [Rhinocladiella mackenziei CBS 650.93]KIX09643.1 hypothetical protein Z518_00724 [Rhinocladiella mackenziei CBS 650.93]
MATVVKAPDGIPNFHDGTENEIYSQIMQSADKLRGDPDRILRHIQRAADAKGFLIALEPEKVEWLHRYLEPRQPKVIVELGTYIGVSTIGFASLLRKCHGDTHGCKIYSCEYSPDFARIARGLVELAGLQDLVEVLEGAAADSVQKLVEEHPNFKADVLFLDHWKYYYLSDLQLCEDLKMLRKGSLVIADNTDIPGVPEYVEYVRNGGRGGHGTVKYTSETFSTLKNPKPGDAVSNLPVLSIFGLFK